MACCCFPLPPSYRKRRSALDINCRGLEWYASGLKTDPEREETFRYYVEVEGLYEVMLATPGANVNRTKQGERGTVLAVHYLKKGDFVEFAMNRAFARYSVNHLGVAARYTSLNGLHREDRPYPEAAFIMKLLDIAARGRNPAPTPQLAFQSYHPSNAAFTNGTPEYRFFECASGFADGADLRSAQHNATAYSVFRGTNAEENMVGYAYAKFRLEQGQEGVYDLRAVGYPSTKVYLNTLPAVWRNAENPVPNSCESRRAHSKVRLEAGEHEIVIEFDAGKAADATDDTFIPRMTMASLVKEGGDVNVIANVFDSDSFILAYGKNGCPTFQLGETTAELNGEAEIMDTFTVQHGNSLNERPYTFPKNDGKIHHILPQVGVTPVLDPPPHRETTQPVHTFGTEEYVSPAAKRASPRASAEDDTDDDNR